MSEFRYHPFVFKVFKNGYISYHFGTLRGVNTMEAVVMEMRFNERQNGETTSEYFESLKKCDKFKMRI